MTSFLLEYDLIPFHLCVIGLLLLSLAETLGYFFGFKPSQIIKHVIPRWLIRLPPLQVKFAKVLILVFFLINFSFAGYFLQLIAFASNDELLPWYYVLVPALIFAIFFTVFMIHCLDQVIKPKYAHTNSVLLGRLATVSSGNARPGFSAQARVRDEFGQIHYVQVEPEFGELEFQSQVLLVRVKKSHYIAKKIARTNQLFNIENC